jgi:hypothetical protein
LTETADRLPVSLADLDPEEYLVMLVMRQAELPAATVRLQSLLTQELPRRLLATFFALQGDREALLQRLAEDEPGGAELQALYARLQLYPAPENDAAAGRELADCCRLLEQRRLKREVNELNRRIRECADDDELQGLLRRKMEMVQQYKC